MMFHDELPIQRLFPRNKVTMAIQDQRKKKLQAGMDRFSENDDKTKELSRVGEALGKATMPAPREDDCLLPGPQHLLQRISHEAEAKSRVLNAFKTKVNEQFGLNYQGPEENYDWLQNIE